MKAPRGSSPRGRPPARKYEGSPADRREDAAGARKLGVSKAAYERTARDRREDAAGRRKLAGPKAPKARR